ncbi:MAG: hypothetical protein ACOC2Y_08110 [Spirochaetota bacterium]
MKASCALLSVILVFSLLAGCAAPEGLSVVTEDEQQPPLDTDPPDAPEPPAEPDPEPEPNVPPSEPDKVPEAAEEPATAPIEVPEEVYNQAFEEVEAIIEDLNRIIARREFETWKTYLTDRYIEYHSDPEVLAELSRQPILAQNNIRLQSLRDYFYNVVVPSRAHARLDDLVFYSDNLVEAVSLFRGQRVILYLLRKIDGQWKIDTFDSLPAEDDQPEESSEAGQG